MEPNALDSDGWAGVLAPIARTIGDRVQRAVPPPSPWSIRAKREENVGRSRPICGDLCTWVQQGVARVSSPTTRSTGWAEPGSA